MKDIKTVLENIQLHKDEAETKKKQVLDNIEEYQQSLNILAGSREGRIFLRQLIKFCGVFHIDNNINKSNNVLESVVKDAQREIYVKYIRPYLQKEHRIEVE